MRKGLLLVLLACALAWASGCRVVYTREPRVRVFRAEKLEPEGWYRDLHTRMEQCSGKSEPFDNLEWFVVASGKMGTVERYGEVQSVVGLFSPPHRIYLSEDRVMDGRVIGHELLHYLTRENDTERFSDILEACGIWE
jgi:hypothetical protein